MKQNRPIIFALIILILASMACSLFTGGDGDAAKPEVPMEQGTGSSESLPQSEETATFEPGIPPSPTQEDLPQIKEIATFGPDIPPSPPQEELSQIITDDGVSMALVPAGPFTMGNDDSRYEGEKPAHTVVLDAYYIDQYEVTNIRYAECVAAGACEPPSSNASATRDSYYDNADFAEYPVMFVSWNAAISYCEWRGARLPTEAEWEKAARGGLEGQQYPWADKFDGTLANYCDSSCTLKYSVSDFNDGYIDTAPVGAYPSNGYGLYDMAGNLWEWTTDWFDPDYYGISPESNPTGSEKGITRVVRGGSWNSLSATLPVSYRASNFVSGTYDFLGFRCVRDVFP